MIIIDAEIGDTIKIGDGITMAVLKAQSNFARLAVEVPEQTVVRGKEEYLRQNRKLNNLRLVK